jgi:hypothetical protein
MCGRGLNGKNTLPKNPWSIIIFNFISTKAQKPPTNPFSFLNRSLFQPKTFIGTFFFPLKIRKTNNKL